MDIFFQDPTEIPLPPNEVRIRQLSAEPWKDGQRVHVYLEVDPFQRRPSADLVIRDAHGQPQATASIIESMTRKMEVTMHIRRDRQAGPYKLSATLYYVEMENDDPDSQAELQREMIVVDESSVDFELPLEKNMQG